jgi:hypothetical protein
MEATATATSPGDCSSSKPVTLRWWMQGLSIGGSNLSRPRRTRTSPTDADHDGALLGRRFRAVALALHHGVYHRRGMLGTTGNACTTLLCETLLQSRAKVHLLSKGKQTVDGLLPDSLSHDLEKGDSGEAETKTKLKEERREIRQAHSGSRTRLHLGSCVLCWEFLLNQQLR